ncbi:hypothetical protein ABT160_02655 [Streptomyces sp. NPDC001941]|uniref:hypothetical protein n=1 Tax=Streptomyces sp. NPDC001941 TaxID=3154659 RepID=UPI0033299D2F
MREWVTTLLDALGLALIAAGMGAASAPLLGWGGLGVSGVVLLAGSTAAARLDKPKGGSG